MALEKVGFEKKYPAWRVRKYRRLIKLFVVPEFNVLVKYYMALKKYPSEALAHMVIIEYKLPFGCFNAVDSFIKYGRPYHGHDLMELIEPEPIQYVNVKTKKRTPTLRGTNASFYSKLVDDKASILIPPNTSREELDDFLDKHFSKGIQPIIGSLGKISRLSSAELAVAAMKIQGKSYQEMNDSLPDTYEEETLRKMFSRFINRKM